MKIRNIGLVNVVAGRASFPEFVQDALQPLRVADALAPLLDRGSRDVATMVEGLDAVRASLGSPGAARRVAGWLVMLAGAGRPCALTHRATTSADRRWLPAPACCSFALLALDLAHPA